MGRAMEPRNDYSLMGLHNAAAPTSSDLTEGGVDQPIRGLRVRHVHTSLLRGNRESSEGADR